MSVARPILQWHALVDLLADVDRYQVSIEMGFIIKFTEYSCKLIKIAQAKQCNVSLRFLSNIQQPT